MLRDSLVRRVRLPLEIIRGARTFRRETEDLKGELLLRARAIGDMIGYTAVPAQETPLNGPIGPHRRLDWLSMPLAHFKMLSKALDCTVNDVVLATVSGAVRDYMLSRRVHPEDIEFRASAPVSVRRPEERGRLGNRVSSWIVELPIGEANARKRLETVKKATKDLKTSQQALGVEMMMAVMEWTPTMLMSLGMRASGTATNMIVTNIPGPQQPLYLLGARLLSIYPVAPLLENTGLSIGLVSLAGKVCWGFNADYELVPDLRNFAKMIERSFQDLAHAAGVDLAAAPREITAREVLQLRSSNGGRNGKRKHTAAVPAARGAGREDQATAE
jgi:WS/DGAT/MGAT family acyltransferase